MTRYLSGGVVAVIVIGYGLPVLLVLATAFRPEAEIFQYGGALSIFSILPKQPTLDGFSAAIMRPDFLRQVVNTFVIGLIQSVATVLVCMMAAYTMARSGRRLQRFLLIAVSVVLFVPYQTVVVPMYLIVRDFGLLDSWTGLILPWLASPMSVLMLKNAIDEVPVEIDEAARVDGAGPYRILFQIIMPNIVPSLATVGVISMVGIYDSLLWPLVSVNDPQKQVAQVGLASFFTAWERPSFATAFAASLIVVAPLLPLMLLFQRQFASTLAASGSK